MEINAFYQLVLLIWFAINAAFIVVMIKILYEVIKLSGKLEAKKGFSMQDCEGCADNYKHGIGYCWRHDTYFNNKKAYNEKRDRLALYEKGQNGTPKKVFIPDWVYFEILDSNQYMVTREYYDKYICEAILYYRYRDIHKGPPKG